MQVVDMHESQPSSSQERNTISPQDDKRRGHGHRKMENIQCLQYLSNAFVLFLHFVMNSGQRKSQTFLWFEYIHRRRRRNLDEGCWRGEHGRWVNEMPRKTWLKNDKSGQLSVESVRCVGHLYKPERSWPQSRSISFTHTCVCVYTNTADMYDFHTGREVAWRLRPPSPPHTLRSFSRWLCSTQKWLKHVKPKRQLSKEKSKVGRGWEET